MPNPLNFLQQRMGQMVSVIVVNVCDYFGFYLDSEKQQITTVANGNPILTRQSSAEEQGLAAANHNLCLELQRLIEKHEPWRIHDFFPLTVTIDGSEEDQKNIAKDVVNMDFPPGHLFRFQRRVASFIDHLREALKSELEDPLLTSFPHEAEDEIDYLFSHQPRDGVRVQHLSLKIQMVKNEEWPDSFFKISLMAYDRMSFLSARPYYISNLVPLENHVERFLALLSDEVFIDSIPMFDQIVNLQRSEQPFKAKGKE